MTIKAINSRRSILALAGLVALFHAAAAPAQVMVQDARGRDLVLDYFNLSIADARPVSSVLTLNSAAESAKGRLLVPAGNTVHQQFHSFEAQYQASDGVVNLLQGGDPAGVQSFGYRYGRSHVLLGEKDRDIDFLVLGLDYSTATYKLFNADAARGEQISSAEFNGLELSGVYSRLIRGAMRASLSVGYRRENNYTDLRSVDVQDGSMVTDGDGDTRFVVTRTTKARTGGFEEFDVYPMGVSLVMMPSEDTAGVKLTKPAFAAYAVTEISELSGPPVRAGINVNLTRQDAKTGIRNTVAGFFLEASDVFDVADEGNGLSERITAGVFLNLKVIEF